MPMRKPTYEYATKSWQVVNGCNESLPCARRCWAKRSVNRLTHSPTAKIRDTHAGLVQLTQMHIQCPPYLTWTGAVRLNEAHLTDPLHWRDPRRVAVASHGDLFLAPEEVIDRVFAVMALCLQHTFLVLTKQAELMREYLCNSDYAAQVRDVLNSWADIGQITQQQCIAACNSISSGPLPNVWPGVSVEDQAAAEDRIPPLLRTPAVVRWVAAEPLLGPLDLRKYLKGLCPQCYGFADCCADVALCEMCGGLNRIGLNWITSGGESGPNARPCNVARIRGVMRQCVAAGVPRFKVDARGHPFVCDSVIAGVQIRRNGPRICACDSFRRYFVLLRFDAG